MTDNYHKRITMFRERRTEMIRLKNTGKSYGFIAKKYGVTRQRVFQILAKVRDK